MEAVEINNFSNKFFTHKEKGHNYIILKLLISKHPDTGEWYDAVLYKQIESGEEFVRSKKSFIENFRVCSN